MTELAGPARLRAGFLADGVAATCRTFSTRMAMIAGKEGDGYAK
jgi:hypothetical protein